MSNKDIMVSIICNTYNHECYIRDALDGFISQKTNFNFEVLVHDDASTDNTANIIKEYESKYPDIIKPIYQTENQYSKKIPGLIGSLQYSRAKGKYIALCEGDDYWISAYKLQRQFDFMESHPEYSLCFHKGYYVVAKTRKPWLIYPKIKNDTDISVEQIILDIGEPMLTNSMFFRKECRDNYPDIFRDNPVGDYPLAVYLSLCGKVYCLEEPMSAYRVMAQGSWSQNNMKKNKDGYKRRIDILKKMSAFLLKLDEYTNKTYHAIIMEKIRRYDIDIMQKYILLRDKKMFLEKLECLDLPVSKQIIYKLNYITNGSVRSKIVNRLRKIKRVGKKWKKTI